MSAKEDYFSALQRLKRNQPQVLPKNSLINKDSVALEAGRKRGSIRKNRDMDDLIAAIDVASGGDKNSTVASLKKKKAEIADKNKLWGAEKQKLIAELDMLRSRNMSLLYQVYLLTRQLNDNHIEVNSVIKSFKGTVNIIEISREK